MSVPAGTNPLEMLGEHHSGRSVTFVVSRNRQSVELTGVFIVTTPERVLPLFRHRTPSGRIDVIKEQNTVRATTRGVEAFTLLLSPTEFDFAQPITVVVDGKTAFSGKVTTSLETLMKWAARDNDRTMLFGAEVHVALK